MLISVISPSTKDVASFVLKSASIYRIPAYARCQTLKDESDKISGLNEGDGNNGQ